jgi:hypothetical protein
MPSYALMGEIRNSHKVLVGKLTKGDTWNIYAQIGGKSQNSL